MQLLGQDTGVAAVALGAHHGHQRPVLEKGAQHLWRHAGHKALFGQDQITVDAVELEVHAELVPDVVQYRWQGVQIGTLEPEVLNHERAALGCAAWQQCAHGAADQLAVHGLGFPCGIHPQD